MISITKTTFVLTMLFSLFWSPMRLAENPKYPVPPKTFKRLFYIQRNHNENTIVYDANFDKQGRLKSNNPVHVYWIRYQEHGQTMPLRTVEKMFAYGVKTTPIKGKPGEYKVDLVATDKRDFLLKQIAPFKAIIYTTIDGQNAILDHIYIYADNSGFWPKVKYVELFGINPKTKKNVYEKMITE
ncbi:DUF4833 domain-containing protein [Candidatus Sulfidibacterium hydrothermale]|uniref:DUF4833 domain-containing protein n=1 Tax=Candidatus Sulfidibacterium hydrothermale TaxID=2875962 RepID=UPI001F0A4297|nr:DUF4833 domain-containing protein [Candidatus Sulfidibacterium hydrothermale]UBM63426.1 DUF4833 domain-containing protein [Candidatus Sulfidibacterium hydrothermale]